MKKNRIKGGGKKLKYKDLDSRLLGWFQERRSPLAESSNSSTLPEKFRREKVTFRRLERQGERISDELLHNRPLALFGDQTKRSINYVSTFNDISGNLPSKVI